MSGNFAYTIVPPAESGNSFNADNEMTNFAGTTMMYDARRQLLSGAPDTYTWDTRRL